MTPVPSMGPRWHGSMTRIVLAFGLLAVHGDLRAQPVWPESGTRIRITVPCDPATEPTPPPATPDCTVTGTFLGARSGILSLASDGARRSFNVEDLRRIDVSQGTRSHVIAGAVVGAVAGLGATYIAVHQGGSTSLCDRDANQDALNAGECAGLIALGGGIGSGLGAVIGSRFRSERWQRLSLGVAGFDSWPAPGLGLRLRVAR